MLRASMSLKLRTKATCKRRGRHLWKFKPLAPLLISRSRSAGTALFMFINLRACLYVRVCVYTYLCVFICFFALDVDIS